MRSVPLLSLVEVSLLIFLLSSMLSLEPSSGVSLITSSSSTGTHRSHPSGGQEETQRHPQEPIGNHSVRHVRHHHIVKRQLVAYRRLEAGPVLPVLGQRRRHGKGSGRRSPVGEDGTDGNLFRSAGVGYEHHHNNRCQESKCGYNIRHCPHGCVFNSFQCGGGSAYDTCCC